MGLPSWAFLRGRPSSSPEHDYFNNNKNIFLQNLIKLGDVVVSRVHVGNTHWTERWPLINIHIKDQSITQSTQRHDPREIKYGPQAWTQPGFPAQLWAFPGVTRGLTPSTGGSSRGHRRKALCSAGSPRTRELPLGMGQSECWAALPRRILWELRRQLRLHLVFMAISPTSSGQYLELGEGKLPKGPFRSPTSGHYH